MLRLEPDQEDLRIASTITLLPCPFCGVHPITFSDQNEATGYVVTRVSCVGCDANVFSCGRDRDAARKAALAKWQIRK